MIPGLDQFLNGLLKPRIFPSLLGSRSAHYRHKRPIGAHFHSGGAKFSYLSQDLEESL
jgi:hypothetical protein